MDKDEIRERILEILQEMHEDVDFEAEQELVDGKKLDSFDLVSLVSELWDEFEVDITAKDFIPENFNSLDAMADMVFRLAEG